jgi:hypothetical protein
MVLEIPYFKKKPKNKTKPKNKNTQAKRTKTHNTKQTEKRKCGRQTSYVTSVMSKRTMSI